MYLVGVHSRTERAVDALVTLDRTQSGELG
jgi:hypothetical protein